MAVQYLTIALVVVLITIIIVLLFSRRRGEMPLLADEMEGHDFEYYCADILRQYGFEEVEVTRGSGDFGVDILAGKNGITYAFQCKCYDRPIGVKDVQEIYAGLDYYDRLVGVVITNQYFTQPAIDMAEKLKIILWDRDYLTELTNENP